MSTFFADIVKKGYTEDEVFGVLSESQRDRRRRRLQTTVIEEVAAHNLKKINELLTYQELVVWRREDGFGRVAEGEESCFHGHRSLPPTPQEYYASLWCEVNALKKAISMPARKPWQKTIKIVDGLKGKLPGWELAEIKRYVEKRCREETEEQMTVTPVDTVQYCGPISQTPEPPSDAYVKLENNEGKMGQELEEIKSSSAGTGLETPEQQCPPTEGIWETGKTTASGILTAGVGPSRGENISSPAERATRTVTVAGISSIAATPSKRRHKTFSEENKQFDPEGQGEKVRLGTRLYSTFFSGESLQAPCCFLFVPRALCFVCVCLPKNIFIFSGDDFSERREGRRGQVADVHNRMTSILSPITLLKLARTSNARFDRSANAIDF